MKIASARNNPAQGTLGETIVIEKGLAGKLFRVCTEALPAKAYGLVGGKDLYHPESIYPCSTNLRNTPEWKSVFESFGDFYKHPDRGFVVSQEECRQILKKMEASGESFIGVYHSHRYTQPVPSKVDMALHVNPILFCYIVSVVNPAMPELKIYRLGKDTYQEIPFETI